MKVSAYLFCIFLLFVLIISGCGLKPFKIPSENITIVNVLDVLERNSSKVRDFDGSGKIEADFNGSGGSAAANIRFIYPSDFRVYLKGFAGIEMARLSVVGDSVTVYFPSENFYIRESRNEEIPRSLLPGIDLNPELLSVIFAGELPPREIWNEFLIILKQYTDHVELTMQRDSLLYRYILDIDDLRVMEEEKRIDGSLQWRRVISEKNTFSGVYFPGKISFEKDDNILNLTFVSGKVNSGLTGKDLLMTVPKSAERVRIE